MARGTVMLEILSWFLRLEQRIPDAVADSARFG